MMIRDKYERRIDHPRRGTSATEMALILPLFVTIVLGCIDFARFAYTDIALTNAVRAGAAWTMLNRPANMAAPAASWQTLVQTQVSNEMSLQPGFASGSLSVATVTPVSETGGTYRFTVTASYPFQTMVNWSLGGYSHTTTLTEAVTMRFIR
jgi:Flp pilus assembly protein TadG